MTARDGHHTDGSLYLCRELCEHGPQPASAFPWKNRARGIRHTICLSCMRAQSREHHAQVKETVNPRIKARRKATAADNRMRAGQLMSSIGCACGDTDPSRMQVVLREGKSLGRRIADGASWDTIEALIVANPVACRSCAPSLRRAPAAV